MENELACSIRDFFDLLSSINIKAHITGGLASSYYGQPRYTQDIDIVVDASALKTNLDQFLSLLAQKYLFSEDTIRAALLSGRVFQVIDDATGFKFDIYPREGVPGELGRGCVVELFPTIHLPLLSLPDCVVSKLQWIQKGSQKSIQDVRAIIDRLSPNQNAEVTLHADKNGLKDFLTNILNANNQEPN